MYNFKDDIAVQSFNYCTRLKSKPKIIIPKTRTVFDSKVLNKTLYNYVVIMI